MTRCHTSSHQKQNFGFVFTRTIHNANAYILFLAVVVSCVEQKMFLR